MYQCGVCRVAYARSDHLIRHVRGHTNLRPFSCQVCSKSFARQDLCKRHMRTHSEQSPTRFNDRGEAFRHGAQHRQRVHRACRACASAKLKCADEKPCKRCKERQLPCELDHSPDSHGLERTEGGTTDPQPTKQPLAVQISSLPLPLDDGISIEPGYYREDHGSLLDVTFEDGAQPDYVQPVQDDFMQEFWGSTLSVPGIGNMVQPELDSVLGDLDFSFLDPISAPALEPVAAGLAFFPESSSSSHASLLGAGTDAFRKSDVLNGWRPENDDRDRQEDQNLILPRGNRVEGSSSFHGMAQTTSLDLSLTARDRILAMILRTASPKLADSIIRSFPSIGVLKNLIHLACVHMNDHQMVRFIHLPSFDLNKQRSELLGALISYGSVCSPSPEVRRFGYAVQEAVRTAIIYQIEENHTPIRDPGVCQAFYIQSYLAYYSGINRKIEIAECYSALGVTLLRRAKALSRQDYLCDWDILGLQSLTIKQKWLRWAEQESRKRLVYFAVTLDAQVSVSRKTAALFPYAELETPLPSSQTLWTSPTAAAWLEQFPRDNSLRPQRLPLLGQLLRQPCLTTIPKVFTDIKSTAFIFLAGFWSLIAEYQQLNCVLLQDPSCNEVNLSARYTELASILDQFRTELVELDIRSTELTIAHEFASLHLNVSFCLLSNYAGERTKEDACLALPYVQKWYGSSKSRTAIWNAGQIFRAAKSLRRRSLADIYTIALYHAALVLWVWSMLRRKQDVGSNSCGQDVVLDGEKSPATWRFLSASQGSPGLTSESGAFLPLASPATAPDIADNIITANWQPEQLPLTTEEVSRLMKEFGSISRRMFE